MRKTTFKKTDKAIFRRTATKTKKLNVNPIVGRGGTRL